MRGGAGDLQVRVRDAAGIGRWIRRGWRALDRDRALGAATASCRMGGVGPGAARRLQHCTKGGEPPAAASADLHGPCAARDIRRRPAPRAMRPRQRCSPSDTSPPCRCSSRCSCIPRAWWASSSPCPISKSGRSSRAPASRRSSSSASACTLLGLILPFASLLWVMVIKLFMGGDIYKNNVTPGVYPKWSRMHLRLWCIAQLESIVHALAHDVSQRAAHGLRVAAARRDRRQQSSVRQGCLPVRPAGLDVHRGRCRHPDRGLHPTGEIGGAIPARRPHPPRERLQDRDAGRHRQQCEVGRGTWITPFTPILSDVGSHEMWEGAPARLSGRCTELKRTANTCRYKQPIWLLETLNILMQIFIFFWLNLLPGVRHPVARPRPHTGRRSRACRRVFQGDAAIRDRSGS